MQRNSWRDLVLKNFLACAVLIATRGRWELKQLVAQRIKVSNGDVAHVSYPSSLSIQVPLWGMDDMGRTTIRAAADGLTTRRKREETCIVEILPRARCEGADHGTSPRFYRLFLPPRLLQ